MKSLLALLAATLLVVGAVACGGAHKSMGSTPHASSNSAASTGHHLKDSNDGDDDPNSDDDNVILDYGHPASAADTRAVTAVAKRYYAAVAADNGAEGCSLMYSLLAEAVAENDGQTPASTALSGKACAVVMSKLFKQRRQQVTTDLATLKVTGVRVEGNRGLALLSFRTMPDRHIYVHHGGSGWKIDGLLDRGLP